MILPSKHINFSQSLLGLGGFILNILNKPMTLDEVWVKYSKRSKEEFPGHHSFDNIVLAIDLLYMIGSIKINENGEISNETN